MNKIYFLLIVSFLLNSSFIGFTNIKKEFKVSYRYFRHHNVSTDKWSDWRSSKNTFVFNINPNLDVMHINEKNEIYTFRAQSGVERYTLEGYNLIKEALDPDGKLCLIQYFYNDKVGLHLIYNQTSMQFAN